MGMTSGPVDFGFAAMQHYCMPTAIPISPRGTITLPAGLRQRLKLDPKEHAMLIVEEREGGIFLHPAITVPVRELPARTIRKWVRADEVDAATAKVRRR
jgi:bifunctional DNA-binding transcriptional regulator/antitoxin component of YhaV-PrlF toxin-antitoxin module